MMYKSLRHQTKKPTQFNLPLPKFAFVFAKVANGFLVISMVMT